MIWAKSTDADVIVFSETWLSKSVFDKDICISGYNVYHTDRVKKCVAIYVAIYVKTKFPVSVAKSETICKQLEFLALNIEVSKGLSITVIGCYRPPSALSDAFSSLMNLTSLLYSEMILIGDLSWCWLKSVSDDLKMFCNSMNLTKLINSPTRTNLKCPEKSTLIDLILTNVPRKYSVVGVFCNDLSDHCAVVAVRNSKVPKTNPCFFHKRNLKCFNEQAFFHDLFYFDWSEIELIPDVETAWIIFHDAFPQIVNKHAPFRRFRVKGRDNPWFSSELSCIIHNRNLAWAKARKSCSDADCLIFRQLRNKCSFLLRKAKSEYLMSVTTDILNDPRKFCKAIKSMSGNSNVN
ncbi:uncharacterized protein LOC129834369 [Salvelinus fontinalis]|uniref:uncharacterized protein LOC129834369 n=1 Tax=Salvelinus fontinalis TaxID=8038 RepID=UPI0024860273|nr:uncharacterized protein LOC129834369 [Salvelinus fontinalis]XP_055755263.1 uncharacterized protein LOC129834369 [Salvelinus fontinalis]